jgi:hypothetical protein
VIDVPKQEFLPRQEEPEKIEFELDDAKSESTKVEEEEPHTPVLRICEGKKENHKGIVHLIFVLIVLYLLLIMIQELSGKQ